MISLFTSLTAALTLLTAAHNTDDTIKSNSPCSCDIAQTRKIIKQKDFNRLLPYDKGSFSKSDFRNLSKDENRLLWYRDVENINPTKFTSLWDDYSSNNYHASHSDFINFYEGKRDIELAFQLGPSLDLWAYHIFVVKKIGCCYLVTRSYFRHARFTYKAYAIIDDQQLMVLYTLLDKINRHPIPESETRKYCGYFADNRNNKKFYIEFNQETEVTAEETKPQKELADLFQFVDKGIRWKKTYKF